MLMPTDDYPLDQTADPITFARTDRNFYDRCFFNGYHTAEYIFFATALGVYPQLNVMDESICLSIDGTQYNLRTSKEMNIKCRITSEYRDIQAILLSAWKAPKPLRLYGLW